MSLSGGITRCNGESLKRGRQGKRIKTRAMRWNSSRCADDALEAVRIGERVEAVLELFPFVVAEGEVCIGEGHLLLFGRQWFVVTGEPPV